MDHDVKTHCNAVRRVPAHAVANRHARTYRSSPTLVSILSGSVNLPIIFYRGILIESGVGEAPLHSILRSAVQTGFAVSMRQAGLVQQHRQVIVLYINA